MSLSALGLLAAPVPSGKPTTYPAWWFARGVIVQTTPTNAFPSWPTNYPISDDYAVINQGQLKNFATQAYNELQAHAPTNVWSTSYGAALTTLVTGWNPTNGDAYAAVNLGQLKTVAAPFYNVLIQIGYSTSYPWTGVAADDYSVANIGQVKNTFSFDVGLDSDGNLLPDWWEIKYFGHTGNNPYSSPIGNGYTLAQDYAGGANPTNYYSWPGTGTNGPSLITPAVAIISGNNQTNSPGTFTAQPLVVKVTNSSGGATLTNAPVTFTVASGGGQVAGPTPSTLGTAFSLITGTNGYAQVFYQQPNTNNVSSSISASSAGQSVSFTETTTVGDGTFDAPSNTVAKVISETEIDLSWVNHASTATSIVIQESTDNDVTWTTIATLSDPTTTSYAVTGLTPGLIYDFQVAGRK